MHCHLCNNYTPETGCDHYGPDNEFVIGSKVLTLQPSGNDVADKEFKQRCSEVMESKPASLQDFFMRLNELSQ